SGRRSVRRVPAPVIAACLGLRQLQPCDGHFQLLEHVRFRRCDCRSLPAPGSLLYAPQHRWGFRLHRTGPPTVTRAERAAGVLERRVHTLGPQERGAITLDQCDKPTRPICIAHLSWPQHCHSRLFYLFSSHLGGGGKVMGGIVIEFPGKRPGAGQGVEPIATNHTRQMPPLGRKHPRLLKARVRRITALLAELDRISPPSDEISAMLTQARASICRVEERLGGRGL